MKGFFPQFLVISGMMYTTVVGTFQYDNGAHASTVSYRCGTVRY